METFLTELIPFFKDFMPLGKVLMQALSLCALILAAAIVVQAVEEALTAKIQMRPARSLTAFLAEGIKSALKEPLLPAKAQKTVYWLSPVFAFVLLLFFFFFLPLDPQRALRPVFSLLYLLLIASIGVYAFIMGAWGSGSRFSFFGAVRMIAQVLSCQLILSFVVTAVLMTAGSPDLFAVMAAQKRLWFIIPHFPLFILYLLCTAMLVVQAPFNSPKASRGLASGLYAEYSGILYWLLQLGETVLMLLMSIFGVFLFLGGSLPVFGLSVVPAAAWIIVKTTAVLFVLVVMKITLPDFRTDRLMQMSYKLFLPFTVLWVLLTGAVVLLLQGGV